MGIKNRKSYSGLVDVPGKITQAVCDEISSNDMYTGEAVLVSGRKECGHNARPQCIRLKFLCDNPQCRHRWISAKVTSIVYAKVNNDENTEIGAKYYLQQCSKCKRVGRALNEYDSEIVERILSKIELILDLRDAKIPDEGEIKQTDPHRQDLCIACKRGNCVTALSESFDNMLRVKRSY